MQREEKREGERRFDRRDAALVGKAVAEAIGCKSSAAKRGIGG